MYSGNNHKGLPFSSPAASAQYHFPGDSSEGVSAQVAYPQQPRYQQGNTYPPRASLFSNIVTTATSRPESPSPYPYGSQDSRYLLSSNSNNAPRKSSGSTSKPNNAQQPSKTHKLRVPSGSSHIILDHPSSQSRQEDYGTYPSTGAVSVRAKPTPPILYIGKGARIARQQGLPDSEKDEISQPGKHTPTNSGNGYPRPQSRLAGSMPLNSATAAKFFQSAGLKVRKSANGSANGLEGNATFQKSIQGGNIPLAIMPSSDPSMDLETDDTFFSSHNRPDPNYRSFSQNITRSRSRSPSASQLPRASYPLSNNSSRSTPSSFSAQLTSSSRNSGPKISPMIQRKEDNNLDNYNNSDSNDEQYVDEYEQEVENDMYTPEDETESDYSYINDDSFDTNHERTDLNGFMEKNDRSSVLLKVPSTTPIPVMPPGSIVAVPSKYSDDSSKTGEKSPESTRKLNDLHVKQARSNRKIMDLEISNASLMKVNKYLEKKLRTQAKHAQNTKLFQKKKDMFGKGIFGLSVPDEDNSQDEDSDKFFSDKTVSEDEDEDEENSDLDYIENTKDYDSVIDSRDRTQEDIEFAEKTRLVEERMQSHIKFLESSEKVNKQIRNCLFISDALLELAKESLSFEVDPEDVKFGGQVASKSFEDMTGEHSFSHDTNFEESNSEEEEVNEEGFGDFGTPGKFKLTEQEDQQGDMPFSASGSDDLGAGIEDEEEDDGYLTDHSYEYKSRTREYASFLPLEVMEEIERELDELMVDESELGNANDEEHQDTTSDDSINISMDFSDNMEFQEETSSPKLLDVIEEENTQELKNFGLGLKTDSSLFRSEDITDHDTHSLTNGNIVASVDTESSLQQDDNTSTPISNQSPKDTPRTFSTAAWSQTSRESLTPVTSPNLHKIVHSPSTTPSRIPIPTRYNTLRSPTTSPNSHRFSNNGIGGENPDSFLITSSTQSPLLLSQDNTASIEETSIHRDIDVD